MGGWEMKSKGIKIDCPLDKIGDQLKLGKSDADE